MEGDDPRYVRVICSTCRAVLHPRVEKAGRRVRCPDCYSAVLVPHPPDPETAPKARHPGAYEVREARAPVQEEATDADFFLVLCPKCQARLHPRPAHVGRRARCPDCETIFVIPPPAKPEKRKPLPTPGKYPMGEAPKRVEPEFHYLTVDRADEQEPEPRSPPEGGWYVRGVFTFPWWPGAVGYWMILSLWFLPALALVGVAVMVAQGDFKRGMAIARLLGVPLVLFWAWVLAYAAACFLAIVGDTGSGNDEVSNWPEGDYRDRFGMLSYVLGQFGLSLVPSGMFASLVRLVSAPQWVGLAFLLALLFFFPLFLLSSMEAATLVTPFSPVILRSLTKTPAGWLMIYIESLVVFGVSLAVVILGLSSYPLATALVASPVLGAATFIQGRLYGRLAWHIGRLQARKRKRKERQRQVTPHGPRTSG